MPAEINKKEKKNYNTLTNLKLLTNQYGIVDSFLTKDKITMKLELYISV